MKMIACRVNKNTGRNPIICILALVLTFVMTFGSFNSAVWAAGDDSYYFGKSTEVSTFNKESTEIKDSYYFLDSWFEKDAAERNDSLALISMQLTAASIGGSESSFGFLEDLGFSWILL